MQLGKQHMTAQTLKPLYPCGSPIWSSWVPASVWPSPGWCGHSDGKSISRSITQSISPSLPVSSICNLDFQIKVFKEKKEDVIKLQSNTIRILIKTEFETQTQTTSGHRSRDGVMLQPGSGAVGKGSCQTLPHNPQKGKAPCQHLDSWDFWISDA